MISPAQIGRAWEPWEVEIEKGRLKLLVKAMGETRPIYTDDEAASRRVGLSNSGCSNRPSATRPPGHWSPSSGA